jgi:MoxR-like ATPase
MADLGASPRGWSSMTASATVGALLDRLEGSIVGQRALLERLAVALLAGGHVLIEGVPGLGKTRAVRSLAKALDLPFRRIPFTPDLLPADLTGTQIYRPATGQFETRTGPIVTSVLLADEINRAPAKVQSALLEAMQDGQVTIGDDTIVLPDVFFVLATQNPVEHEGTYPLPEAQLDRFLMKLLVGYPDRDAELAMLELPGLVDASERRDEQPPLLGPDDVRALKAQASAVHVARAVREYAVDLVAATRDPGAHGLKELAPLVLLGGSPRATLGLIKASQALALIAGRDYTTPHDVKSLAADVLRHRLIPSFEAEAEGLSADDLIDRIVRRVPAP